MDWVAFSIELLQEVAHFEDFGDKKVLKSRDLKMERLMVKSLYRSTFS